MISIRFRPFFLILTFTFIILLFGCSNYKSAENEGIQDSIKDMIEAKDETYDFLHDEKYIGLLNDSMKDILMAKDIDTNHLIIGNLSDSNIPEIIFFRERDNKNIHDPGYLEIYSYRDEKYSLLDRASMNYDKTNYQLELGKVSQDRNGIYLNNYAGSNFAITYGFILKDSKLVNILNPKKVNLISFNDDNEIKDYNDSGILEFSISAIDPENYNGSYTKNRIIKYRYNWDGKDGAKLIDMEREKLDENFMLTKSDKEILTEAKKLLKSKDVKFINFILENKGNLSPLDNTHLIIDYISYLRDSIFLQESKFNNLLTGSSYLNYSDKLKEEYFISIDLLNDIDYISRQKVLSNEEELKNFLISTLKAGYIFSKDDDGYLIDINYKFFFDNFKDCIQNEYKDYLRILSNYTHDNMSDISLDTLAERIVLIENFNLTYPYSDMVEELSTYHDEYLEVFFQGNPNQIGESKLKPSSGRFKKKLSEKYMEIKERYYHSYISDLISRYLNK